MRVLAAGDAAVLVELTDLEEVLRLCATLDALRAEGELGWVIDVVPAARTVLLRCRPGSDLDALAERLPRLDLRDQAPSQGEEVTVPVVYDGEDLEQVAELTGLSPEEVVERHVTSAWRVAFTGFAPGFGYLVGGPFDVPRRREPRTEVPAGAVGLAGEFTGVYPRRSPGGWQLIGRTTARIWDPSRERPALLAPGTRVRFEVAS